jgi:hypothetical protein
MHESDRKNGVGGFWGLQILPVQNIASYPSFVAFEKAVHRTVNSHKL